jgi:type III secretion system YscQ/HrcQ family protein
MTTKKLRRFRWAQLPKVSRQQARLVNTLLVHLPQTPFMKGFKERLRALLEGIIHADVDVWLDSTSTVEPGTLATVVATPSVLALVGLVPLPHKMLVEIDLPIAQLAIDRLLGGDAHDVDAQRPLSEIEEGIFQFVLLKVLHLLQETMGGERQVGFKLENVAGSLTMLEGRYPADERYVAMNFKLFFDTTVGTLRVLLPAALVEGEFPVAAPQDGPALQRWLASLQDRKELVRLLRTQMTIEVGRLQLPMADVENLGVDDIIVIEQTDGRMLPGDADTAAVLSGQVTGRIGLGAHGAVMGTVQVGDSGRYEVTIDSLVAVGEPAPMALLFGGDVDDAGVNMQESVKPSRRVLELRFAPSSFAAGRLLPTDNHHGHDDDAEHSDGYDEDLPSVDAAAMLADVTVAMVIELGRVQVSAADVMGLRPGQVIELGRSPGEAIDLVVDGKRIGKGELVEIDGEMGVRILSLAR